MQVFQIKSYLWAGPLSKFCQAVKGEVKVFLEPAGSRLPLAQNNPQAKGAHFGLVFLPPLRHSFSVLKEQISGEGQPHYELGLCNADLVIGTFAEK